MALAGGGGGGDGGEASLESDSLGQEASKEEAHQIQQGPFFLSWSLGRPLSTRRIKIIVPVPKKKKKKRGLNSPRAN